MKLPPKTTIFLELTISNPGIIRAPFPKNSKTEPKLSPDWDTPCLMRSSWRFYTNRGSGRLSRISIGKKRFRQVPLFDGGLPGNTHFLRREMFTLRREPPFQNRGSFRFDPLWVDPDRIASWNMAKYDLYFSNVKMSKNGGNKASFLRIMTSREAVFPILEESLRRRVRVTRTQVRSL